LIAAGAGFLKFTQSGIPIMKNCMAFALRAHLFVITLLLAPTALQAQSWSGATSGDWLTGTNWSGGTAAGSTSSTDTDIAVFGVNANNTIGINMTTASGVYYLGAIDNTNSAGRTITNTTGTSGTLTLNGATVNGVANTIIRNSVNGSLDIRNDTTSGTLGLDLAGSSNVIQNTNSGAISIRSSISGSGGITRQGSGTGILQLYGNNSYAGVTATNGIITIFHSNALGATGSGNNTTIAATGSNTGGVLQLSGGITTEENITITGTTEAGSFFGAIRSISGNNTVSGDITLASPTGSIRLEANAGNLTFSGSITQTGTSRTLVLEAESGRTLTVNNAIANNGGDLSTDVGGTVILNGVSGSGIGNTTMFGGTLKLGVTNALNTTRPLELFTNSGTRTFDLAGFGQAINALIGSGTSAASTDRIVTNSAAGSGTSILTVGNGGGSGTFNGQINNGATAFIQLIKTGAGNQTLSGSNSFTGGTRIDAGTLTLGNASNTLANTGAINVNGGTLALGGNSDTVGAVTLTSGSITSSTGVLTGSSYAVQSGSVSAILGGSGVALTKSTTGTVILSGNNTYTGATSVNAGTLSVATLNNASTAGPLGNSAAAVLLGSSGTTGTLEYTGASASSTKPFTAVTGGTAAFSVANAATTLTLSGLIDGSGTKSFGGPGSYVVSGAISGGSVIKTGAGTLTLANSNGQANTTVNEGQLNINQFAALGTAAGTLTMAGGTSLDNTSGSSVTITNSKSIALGNSLAFLGTNDLDLGEGTTTLSATTTFTVSAGTLTLSGDVVGTGFGIVKDGAGTLRLDGLTGTGSFTGDSAINAGTLLLEGSAQLGGGASTVVTLGANGFLQVGPSASLNNVTIAGFTGNVISASVINANQDFTQSTTLTTANENFNGVQTIGSGVTLTAPANYLGTIPASATAGRIVFESGATLAATAGFSIDPRQGVSLAAGTATVSVVAGQAVFFESAVAGTGGLRKTGAGNLRLTGTNTYQGGTVVNQGILGISSGAALGDVSGGLTIDGAILAAATNPDGSGTGATIDAARTVRIGNGKTNGLHAQNGLTLRYDGVIAEIDLQGTAGGLQVGLVGPREGTVILGGANTYRGDTTLSAGTLKLGSGGSFANSPRIIVGDAAGSAASIFDVTEKTSFTIGATQTLMGKGQVLLGQSTTLTIDGVFSPGNSPGLFTYDGGGTATLAGTTLMEIQGTVRGSGYDAVDVLNGTTLNLGGVLQLDFNQAFPDDTVLNLFTPSSGSSLAGTFSTISMVGSAYGDLAFTQAGTSGIWNTNVGAANQSMTFTSSSGTLSILAVPEPGTLTLAALGLAAGLGWHLRRRA
jgi:autotransporter-associated beta strand protein